MFGLLAAEENTPGSRLLLVGLVSSIAAHRPVIKVADGRSNSTELSETVSTRFRFRRCSAPTLGLSQLEIFREVMS